MAAQRAGWLQEAPGSQQGRASAVIPGRERHPPDPKPCWAKRAVSPSFLAQLLAAARWKRHWQGEESHLGGCVCVSVSVCVCVCLNTAVSEALGTAAWRMIPPPAFLSVGLLACLQKTNESFLAESEQCRHTNALSLSPPLPPPSPPSLPPAPVCNLTQQTAVVSG